MSIQFESTLDAEKSWQMVQNKIDGMRRDIALWNIVKKTLAKFDGKQINKRIETALQNELPDYTISYSNQYGLYNIYIWGNGIPYDKRNGYHLGWTSHSNILDMKTVINNNMCWELDNQRVSKLMALDKAELYMNVEKWNNGLAAMQQVHKWAESFEIQYNGFDIK